MAAKDTANDRKDDQDNEPMTDTSQTAVKKMIAEAREKVTSPTISLIRCCRLIRSVPNKSKT